jgi:MFS family permease
VKGIYYGWWIVALSVAANMLTYGTTFNAFQLYVAPASKDYGLSRADMNTAMVIFSFGSAAISPLLGRLADLVSPRLVMIAGALMLGGAFLVLGLTHSVWLSAAMFALPLAVAVQACAQITMPLLINRWFVRQRGRAMAIAAIGISFGLIFSVPTVGLLITDFGWRRTLLMLSGIVTALLVGLSFVIRERPAPGEIEPGGPAQAQGHAQAGSIGAPLRMLAILGMPQFWTIAVGASLAAGVASAIAVSIVPIAEARGLPLLKATGLVSLTGMAGIGGKLLLTVIADKVSRIYLMVAVFLIYGAANLFLLAEPGAGPMLIGFAVATGVAGGAMAPLLFALLADRFGAASFGTVSGLLAPLSMLAGAVGTRFAGEVFDRTGGYDLMHLVFVVCTLISAAVMFATRFTRSVTTAGPTLPDTAAQAA